MVGEGGKATWLAAAARLALAIVLAGLAAPGLAAASTYTWAIDGDGDWNNPANWMLQEGPLGAGYPNQPGDIATFIERFTAPRTVTIPDGVIITIGHLTIREGSSLLIAAAGSGKLVIEADGFLGGIISAENYSTAHVIAAPVELHTYLAVDLGSGTMTFTGGITESGGRYEVSYVSTGTVRLNSSVSNTYTGVTSVRRGTLILEHLNGTTAIPATLFIGAADSGVVEVRLVTSDSIANTSLVGVGDGLLNVNDAAETIGNLEVGDRGVVRLGPGATGRLAFEDLVVRNARLTTGVAGSQFVMNGDVQSYSASVIDGGGSLLLTDTTHTFSLGAPSLPADIRIDAQVAGGPAAAIVVNGPGLLHLTGTNTFAGDIRIGEGTVLLTGEQPQGSIHVDGDHAVFEGTGPVGPVTVARGLLAPGSSAMEFDNGPPVRKSKPGVLRTGSLTMAAYARLAIQLNGASAGVDFDQVKVVGAVDPGGAVLDVTLGFAPPPFLQVTIVENDGNDAIASTFNGLPEGARFFVGDTAFLISYVGGDGNDVVLRVDAPTYLLAEGATGTFFDEDVSIANPATTDAPVTLTFMKEDGSTVLDHRTVPAQSRITVHVDAIPGLEATAASVQVRSETGLPLVVERSMFWDASYYGGHTANAVVKPQTTWLFAEGSQGFFDTYILVVNPNDAAITVQATFLPETGQFFSRAYEMAARSRLTIYAGADPALVNQSFGMIIGSSRPVVVERAMYFGSTPDRLWAGGHVNMGIAGPSKLWFHAEGAIGGFFNTFILLSNNGPYPAHVRLNYLLDSGEVIVRDKSVPGVHRLTVNPATDDPRLENAAFSTVVQSDQSVVSERSMYWPGEVAPFGEGHNSAGIVTTRTTWGLAEGRVGGPHEFLTYILLANPANTTADVSITYLREGAPPVVKTYTVPPRHRFNIDVRSAVPEIQNESFGARIEVTNGVAIAVERSMYWNANGVFWAGGTNALGTPIP
jgi:autotransporter-associated beta strand protein